MILLNAKDKKMEKSEQEVIAVPTDVYSRSVGYYRPVKFWNEGKQEEFKDRNYLSVREEK